MQDVMWIVFNVSIGISLLWALFIDFLPVRKARKQICGLVIFMSLFLELSAYLLKDQSKFLLFFCIWLAYICFPFIMKKLDDNYREKYPDGKEKTK
jgi:hypothetical protein